ncbi:MAG: hypothetical protein OXH69_17955 [Acidobacteria bacterium]|nr:hypothetical protein [Acidobacteriota bacterium]
MAAMYESFLVVHLISLFLLAGVTFAALAAPDPERRRFFLMWSGILSVVAFVTGFGLLGIRRIGYPGWVWVKLAAWLALAVAVPLVYRRAAGQQALLAIMIGAFALAVAMVIYRPF